MGGTKDMKKTIKVLTLFLMLGLVIVGCSNDSSGSDDTEGKIEIDLWFSLSGDNGDAFKKIIEEFNEQSDEHHVNAVYQGSYTDTITKIRVVGDSEAPALLQASGTNRKYLAERDYIEPMQDFIDEHDFDTSELVENVQNRYTIDDKL